MLMGGRRDSFCGKISVCNNLWQYGIKFTLITNFIRKRRLSPDFLFGLDQSFAATCRMVEG